MEYNDLVSVSTLTNSVEAEILKNFLQAEGIHCTLEGEETAANLGLAAFAINVMVRAGDADHARKLIETHNRHKGSH